MNNTAMSNEMLHTLQTFVQEERECGQEANEGSPMTIEQPPPQL